MRRDLLAMAGVVAVFVAGGTILMQSKILPEEHAQDFRTLGNITLQSKVQVIQEPTPKDNTYIYAINEVAKDSWEVARQDDRVKAILADAREGNKALTVAAVQPTAFVSPDGKVAHSSSGQVMITENSQFVDGAPYYYSDAKSFASLEGRQGQAIQKIWNVFVDLDQRKVLGVQDEQERVVTQTLHKDMIYGGINIYLPDAVTASAGSTIRWVNQSSVPHNVVGTYVTASGSEEKLDSGFFGQNDDWQHTFAEKGTFEYHCTIHSEEGMKGKIVIS